MWLSSALVVYSSGRINPVAIIVLLAVALSGLLFLSAMPMRTAVAVIVVGILIGASIALLRTIPLSNSIIRGAQADRRIVAIDAYVTADPIEFERKQALDWSSQSASVVEISTRQITVGVSSTLIRVPMSVFSTAQTSDLISSLIPGTHIRVVGKLKIAQPGRKYAATLNATAIEIRAGPARYQVGSAHLRNGLHGALEHSSPAAQGLVPGLALGDSSELTTEVKHDMRLSGLTHLIAVSGANVALVLAFIHRFTFRRTLRFQFLISVTALAAYVVLVRPQPSVVRAAVMAVIVLMAHSSHWKIHALPSLCSAVIVLLAVDPWLSTSYGFVLSVLATAGLVIVSSRLQQSFERTLPQRIPRWVIELLALTTAAQLAVLPVVIGSGSRISLASIPANVIAVPLATPAMFSGLAAAVCAVVSLPLAHLVVLPGVWAAQVIAYVAHLTARSTALSVTFPAGIAGVVTAVIVVGITMHMWKQWNSADTAQRQFIATFLTVCIFLTWWRPDLSLKPWPAMNWRFVVCDVGQGDGLVLRTGINSAIVLDAGSEPEAIDRCLQKLHVSFVPLFVMTHFHADHVGGVQGVFRHRTVKRVWVTALLEPAMTTAFALRCLQQEELKPEVIGQLHHETIGDVDLQVVWPGRIITGQGSDPNNASIAIIATVNGHKLFLSGDLEPAAQAAILESWPVPEIDVLKVAHHGSSHQFPALIERMNPHDAVISVGQDNDYGHPAAETIALLNSVGARVWRTDMQGALTVVEQGDLWVVQPQHR